MFIPAQLRREVIERAAHRCEYCGLAQAGQEAAFHVDHVIPLKAGGATTLENLALACVSCSLRKGAQLNAIDPETNVSVQIFNPRRETWSSHFRWNGNLVMGLTLVGRATAALLKMNRPLAVAIRAEEAARGRHPANRF